MNKSKDARLERLNETLITARRSPFYAERLKDSPKSLEAVEDLQTLPLTTKQDLRDNYPFGTLSVDFKNVIEVHTTSGTTGKPTLSFLTQKDLDRGSEAIANAWRAFGINDKSRVQFIMGYGLFSGAMLNTYAIQKAGGFVLPAGILPTYKQFELMKDFQIDTLVATPGYFLYLYDYALEQGIDLAQLNLKRGIAAGEVYSDQIREDIERKLGIVVHDHYGLCEVNTGIAYECEARQGLHILDDYVIAEVVNPKTGLPCAPHEDGELVLTSLQKEASPIIRYKTGDLTQLIPGACACGRTSMRIGRMKGRVDDLLFIKGLKINPHEIKEQILSIAQNSIYSDIRIVTKRNSIKHTPKILVSLKEPTDLELLTNIKESLREKTYLNFDVEHIGVEAFNRESSTKVKLVEYVE